MEYSGIWERGLNLMSNDNKSDKSFVNWLAIGVALGTAFGIIFHNLAVGVAIGVAIGAGIGGASSYNSRNN